MGALFGRIFSGGNAVELQGGVNFKNGLRARANAATGVVDVELDGELGASSIGDGAVTTAAIADDAVTAAKLDDAAAGYATYDDARAALAAGLDDGRVVLVRGRDAAGDGCEGLFVVETGGSYTDDDGVCLTSTGLGGAATGTCVRRVYSGAALARWWGVTPAAADIRAPLLRAIAAADHVAIDAGSFNASADIEVTAANKRISGAGKFRTTITVDESGCTLAGLSATSTAGGLVVEGLTLQGTTPFLSSPSTTIHGFAARCVHTLRDVYILSFSGAGYDLRAAVAAGSNANGSSVRNVLIRYCSTAWEVGAGGLDTDTNALDIAHVQALDMREAGFVDHSLLGSTYVACLAENCVVAYETTGANCRNMLFLGCYREDGQVVRVRRPALVLGGIGMVGTDLAATEAAATVEGTVEGARVYSEIAGHSLQDDLSALGLGDVRAWSSIGVSDTAGCAAAFGAYDPGTGAAEVGTFRLEYGRRGHSTTTADALSWWWRESNFDVGAALGFLSVNHLLGQCGFQAHSKAQAWSIALGSPANPTIVSNAPFAPTYGKWRAGDLLLVDSAAVAAGGKLGWRIVTGDGTGLGTYEEVWPSTLDRLGLVDTTTGRVKSTDSIYQGTPGPVSRMSSGSVADGASVNADVPLAVNSRLARIVYRVSVGDYVLDQRVIAKRDGSGTVTLITPDPLAVMDASDYGGGAPAMSFALSVSGANVRLTVTNDSGASQTVRLSYVLEEENVA